jgi:hypothetical protein
MNPLRALCICVPVLLACGRLCAEMTAREEAEAIQDKRAAELATLMALPRIPTRDEVLKDVKEKEIKEDVELTKTNDWVQNFIDKKKAQAEKEIDELKKKFQQDEQERIAKEKERQRRLTKMAEYGDYIPVSRADNKRSTVTIKLDFQVPEVETCRRAQDACRLRKALADDIIDTLSRLDRNNDGKLTNDEYQDALAIVIGAAKLFQKIDTNDDGFLSEAEIESAKQLPKDAADALQKGRAASRLPNAKLKPYDANDDNVLDAEERKTLSMAFVDLALKAEKEAEFYRHLADSLTVSRDIMAAKYANVVLSP